jgi:hypothetical protein
MLFMCESVFVFTALSDLNCIVQLELSFLTVTDIFSVPTIVFECPINSDFSVSDRSNKYENENDLGVFSTVFIPSHKEMALLLLEGPPSNKITHLTLEHKLALFTHPMSNLKIL